jgi:hypothetical protein
VIAQCAFDSRCPSTYALFLAVFRRSRAVSSTVTIRHKACLSRAEIVPNLEIDLVRNHYDSGSRVRASKRPSCQCGEGDVADHHRCPNVGERLKEYQTCDVRAAAASCYLPARQPLFTTIACDLLDYRGPTSRSCKADQHFVFTVTLEVYVAITVNEYHLGRYLRRVYTRTSAVATYTLREAWVVML